ncbi:MAG: long-chain fatty acid--CoA ligase [Microscillaceae bacterium]|nr:long-chain fatty acid--CoA ligase [Microscillaceae bacterium]
MPDQEGVFAFKDLMDKASEVPFPDQSQWDALALLIYTGGTTGVSKGVMLTHANLSCTVQQTLAFFSNVFKPGEDVAPAIYPFFHVGGHSVVQNTFIWNGATLHLVPRPEAKSLAQLLRQHRFTVFQAVPTLFVGLLQEPSFREADLSGIKIFGTGAAPMSGATYLALKELAPQVMVTEGYGMTETGGLITSTPATARFKQGSVGLPLPDTEVRIVDLEKGTQEMPLGQAGEVVVKGPQVMAGYYQRPDQTKEVFQEGWLHTGDIGYLDEEGWLFLIDRKKDMILASGYNIYPKEIDEVLYTHPDILEACTVGIPDAYRGETVKVFIVRKPGSTLQAEEVEAFCREKLAAYKVPRLVEFVAELPKSAVGKILRRALRPDAPEN